MQDSGCACAFWTVAWPGWTAAGKPMCQYRVFVPIAIFVLATVKCEFTFLSARQATSETSKSAGYPLLARWMHHACISFT